MASPFKTSVKLNTDDMAVEVSVIDKATDEVAESEAFPAANVAESLRSQVGLYGLSKLLQDRSSDTPPGPEKLAAMRGVASQLAEGRWAKERTVGAAVVSTKVEALAQLKGLTVAQTQTLLKGYNKEQKAMILGNAKVVEKAAEIEKAREADDIASKASFDDMLSDAAE